MLIKPADLSRIWPWIASLSLGLLLFSLLCSLLFGAVPLSVSQFISWVGGNDTSQAGLIIERLRLPRALLAMAVGSILAVSGAATQGLFRNPLADPSLIGVSAGAAAGASIVIVLLHQWEWGIWGFSLVSVGAFVGSIGVVGFVYSISTNEQGTRVSTMLLAGIAFTFLAGSITSLLEFVSDNEMLRRLSLWRMGSLDGANYQDVMILIAVSVISYLVLFRQHKALNVMLLGESEARHLGIDVKRVKRTIIISVAAGVGIAVALSGTIAFIGLMVPHLVRLVIGPNHRYLIPLSALLGATLLVVADIFARTLISPTELPVGLVTALLGAPVFLSLLRHRLQYSFS
ncbi:FecCD family ABC transporter permease [Teredinibacter haidensis]|uniref:FecCD family ABC transporter permease n=1 Tax=Teredinibacter haidensis TaxID=2731755 RepID=UPI000948C29B|nr:iron ABC transporter permease [Teredinibacter haidensis]